MEPLFPEDTSGNLERLANELIEKSLRLSNSLHPLTREAIGDFLRPMNSYYSNLIEGHDTHPIDIDRALSKDFSSSKKNRALQLEAKAHIELHKVICSRYAHEKINPFTSSFLTWIHHEFYRHLPYEFTKVKKEDGSSVEVTPGEFRKVEVRVGRHVAPHSDFVNDFVERFEEAYNPNHHLNKSKTRRIINMAAAHHRLAWIHPFLDGNGRVVRLFSDACFMYEDLHASGLWSMSRALAVSTENYKYALAGADSKRVNDYDGRGNLSNRELVNFCTYFLKAAIDQIEYMSSILEVDSMLTRIHRFVDLMVAKNKLKDEARYVLELLFLKGKVTKTEVERVTRRSDKTAKAIANSLIDLGLIKLENDTKFSAYLVNYPIKASSIILHGLYPRSKELDIIEAL